MRLVADARYGCCEVLAATMMYNPESVQFDSASVSSKIMGDRQVHSLSCCLTKSSQRSKRSLISTLVADPLYIMVAASTSQQPYLASATSLIKALKTFEQPFPNDVAYPSAEALPYLIFPLPRLRCNFDLGWPVGLRPKG
jgi:hypothetical protein